MNLIAALKNKAKELREHTLTVYFVARDPRTPAIVKILAVFIAAYALSPIDLIPDFIPVIGYLDDLLLIPLGLYLVVRLTPPEILESSRFKAQGVSEKPISYSTAIFIVVLWFILFWFVAQWIFAVVSSQ